MSMTWSDTDATISLCGGCGAVSKLAANARRSCSSSLMSVPWLLELLVVCDLFEEMAANVPWGAGDGENCTWKHGRENETGLQL